MARTLTVYSLTTVFDFGCYNGKTFEEVIVSNENYIYWCIHNVNWFAVSEECFSKMELMQIKDVINKNSEFSDGLKNLNRTKIENHVEQLNRYSPRNDYYESDYGGDYYNDSDEWLIDAAGCNDPEVMNDVYWNLD